MNKELYKEYVQECLNHPDFPDCREVNKGWEYCPDSVVGVREWLEIKNPTIIPLWLDACVRRKKKTVTINGVEVVEPIRDRLPEKLSPFSTVIALSPLRISSQLFTECDQDFEKLELGWHENKEDAQLYWNTVLNPYLANYPS